jgi:hypothetical protein
MVLRLKNPIAACLLVVAGPAWAGESFVNGEPLQYNYEYHCNGERVIVGRCRDNDDDSYCQDYYPDRPLHNGLMVQPVERRGDVVAKLNACARAASASNEPSGPRSVTSPTASRKTSSHGTVLSKPPGLGRATWHILETTNDGVYFFTTAGIKHSAKSGRGWFTTVFSDLQNFGAGVSAVRFTQGLVEADCPHNTMRVLQFAAYDADQKLVKQGPTPNQSFERVEPDGLEGQELAVLCGKPRRLAGSIPAVGDGEYLWGVTQFIMAKLQHDAAK